jgi:hypothetical protein
LVKVITSRKHFTAFLVFILSLAVTLVAASCSGLGSTQASGGQAPAPSPSPTPAPAPSPSPTPTPGSSGLTATPGSVNFGNVALNATVNQTIKIANPGNTAVTVTQDSLMGTGLSTGLTTPLSLGAGQSVNAQISFLPTVAGPVNGSLVLSSNGSTVLTVPILGSGVAPLAHSVAISWNASTSSGVQGYNVYRSTVSGGPYAKISSTLTAAVLAFTDLSPVSGQKYFYIVTSVDGTGTESLASNEVGVTIPTP